MQRKMSKNYQRNNSWRYQNTGETEIPVDIDNGLNLLDTTYFNDGIHCVDYILLWIKSSNTATSETEKVRSAYRKKYEECLKKRGLMLETSIKDQYTDVYYFVKIHLPKELLLKYAEELQFKFPIKYQQSTTENAFNEDVNKHINCISRIFYNYEQFPPKTRLNKTYYCEKRKFLFDTSKEDLISPRQRSCIVKYILEQEKYGHRKIDFGLQRLLAERAYEAAYALHDGDLNHEESMRYKLTKHWASVRKWYQFQPLDYIKDYFGTKIGLYFAWLEFYTLMLGIAALIGVSCIIVSAMTINTSEDTNEICASKVTMCPHCDQCETWSLNNSCFFRKLSYLVDNPVTVVFAMFMSLWSVMLLEFFKRRQAKIQYDWDISDLCSLEQPSRPEYHIQAGVDYGDVKYSKTGIRHRPNISFKKRKLPARFFSTATVLLLVLLATAATISIIVYRTYTTYVLSSLLVYGRFLATLSSAFINLLFILIFNILYQKLAEKLTNFELHRTQVEYDDSLALKVYVLKFINYYSTLIYIAFFKSNTTGYPAKYSLFFGMRQEECSNGGCLSEMTIQLLIIFGLKQTFNSLLEMTLPILKKWYKSRGKKHQNNAERWYNDFQLQDFSTGALIPEYMEMVIQFGFVTLFSFAFPLAPLLALVNNIFEIRLDAKKLIKYSRRTINEDVKDIGIWFKILKGIVRISVLVNGLIIAFTSDFIPKLVYRCLHSEDGSLKNYVNFTLSSINPEHYNGTVKLNETCNYFGFREHTYPYEHTTVYYTILTWRLVFVLMFENLLFFIIMIINWSIPDVPRSLQLKMNKERRFLDEILLKREKRISRGSDNFSFYETLEKNRNKKVPENVKQEPEIVSSVNKFDNIEVHAVDQDQSNVEEIEMEFIEETKYQALDLEPESEQQQHFEEIELEPPNLDENSAVANIQDVLYRKTDGLFPDDVRMTIRESNLSDLTATLNEISELVEEINTTI